MTEPTTDERIAAAAEATARHTDTLVVIALFWSFTAALGLVVGLILWIKGA